MYLSYDHLQFRYEPFPIGLAKPVMDEGAYREFVDHYPPLELFHYIPKVGHKYALSETFNPERYRDLVRSHPLWREFHRWIKSDEFVEGVMGALREHYVDLGYDPSTPTLLQRLSHLTGRRKRKVTRLGRLRARFEFSMLPADGGYVRPHTDAPSKIVTLIVSMVREGEWDPAVGGGTDVNRPRDSRLCFNRLNRKAEFEDVEVLYNYAFTPNQAVVFIKTFNSWHSVRPMTGTGSQALRRTLTINIEALS